MPEKIEIPAEIIAALTAGEMTYRAASRLTGVALGTLHNRVQRATAEIKSVCVGYDHISFEEMGLDGVQRALDRLGIAKGQATGGWIKDRGASVRFRIPAVEQEDTLDTIVTRLSAIKPARPSKPPRRTTEGQLSLYPVFDLHFGMLAYGRETGGQDYDTSLARQDLETAFDAVMGMTPDAEDGLLLLGGDNLHANDQTSETLRSRHKLDMDGRHGKVVGEAIEALASVSDRLISKHKRLRIRVLEGNHDPDAHWILSHALAQRYRLDERVTVETDLRDLFMLRHGRCGIFAHHGHKQKPQALVGLLAATCPWWSEVRHRHVYTGHVHHDQVKDFPGARWESLRPFCEPDAYGSFFSPMRALQSITFDEEKGLIQRNLDYIERRAAA